MSKTKLRNTAAVAIISASLATTSILSVIPSAQAASYSSTVTSSITTLAEQIENDSQLVNSELGQAVAGQTLAMITSPSFDWNEVMFGTDTLTPSQSATANQLTGEVKELLSFNSSDATGLIESIISSMQSLNSAVQASDVVTFLSNIVNGATGEFSTLSGISNAQDAATQMHGAFQGYLSSASSAIQALFSPTGPAGGSGIGGGAGADTGTTDTVPTGSGDAFTSLLQSVTVDASAKTIQAQAGSSTIEVQVPAGAFSTSEQISVVSGTASDATSLFTANATYSNLTPVSTFGIAFTGATPTSPITVTVSSSDIQAGDQVFKVGADGALTPVQATVSDGQVTLTITSDPDFVIATDASSATTGGATGTGALPSWKGYGTGEIVVDGTLKFAVPSLVKRGTTYMPIWYVMQTLKGLGFTTTWNGHVWKMKTPATTKPNLSNIKVGTGTAIDLNGTLIEKAPSITAIDPTSGKKTTYIPIWYVMQALNRANVSDTWKSPVWSFK